ncbi:hypothetical protein CORC01_03790 [Colletotrichum orchidophilum]|uniref:Uncharacterized protein n=1 Tax=Colletotrichum orchidophilum TaxID=1209926 RepID=A0A1G4BHR1_9PEZI|nr:uncharacterized protein CORC01_03790 [Colletotrichum orchidophilum]OHF00962.1 hypothetical protein CORC01_03790 [Colletotrichum orchidophilum]
MLVSWRIRDEEASATVVWPQQVGWLRQQSGCGSCVCHHWGLPEPRTATTSTAPRRREKSESGRQWTQPARMNRISILLLLICGLVALVSANSPTFCKCTCFKNSTIVALGPQHADGDPPGKVPPASSRRDVSSADIHKRAASSSCSQCTKAFCLSRGIDFCRDAKDEDVQTMCFQRDSNKDRVIVWGFLLGTSGLLGWAVFKRANELREGKRAADAAARNGAERGDYSQLSPARPN